MDGYWWYPATEHSQDAILIVFRTTHFLIRYRSRFQQIIERTITALTEVLEAIAHRLRERDIEVGLAVVVDVVEQAARFDGASALSGQDKWHVAVEVCVAITDFCAQEDHAVVEHGAFAFGAPLEFAQQVGKLFEEPTALGDKVGKLAFVAVVSRAIMRRLVAAHVEVWVV